MYKSALIMLIIAEILANYFVNLNSSSGNHFPDLKYVHIEATIKYIANIKLKRLIIEQFRAPILKSTVAATWCEISSGS